MEKHNFTVILNDFLTFEIQEAVDYYNSKKKGLGTQFYKQTKEKLKSLKNDALYYQVRYTSKESKTKYKSVV